MFNGTCAYGLHFGMVTSFTIHVHDDLGSGAASAAIAYRAEEIWQIDDQGLIGKIWGTMNKTKMMDSNYG